jgi:hypothetical protein
MPPTGEEGPLGNRFNSSTTFRPSGPGKSCPAEVWDSYFKLTIERNGYDLAVSAYFWRNRKEPRPRSVSSSSRLGSSGKSTGRSTPGRTRYR